MVGVNRKQLLHLCDSLPTTLRSWAFIGVVPQAYKEQRVSF